MKKRLRHAGRSIVDGALPVGSRGRTLVRNVRTTFRRGFVDAATWFAEDVLLVRGWFAEGAAPVRATWQTGNTTTALPCARISYVRPERGDREPLGKLIALELPRTLASDGSLVLEIRGGRVETTAEALERATVPLRHWLELLPPACTPDSPARREFVRCVHAIARNARRRDPVAYLEAFGLLDLPPSPAAALRKDGTAALVLDSVLAADDRSFVIEGWARGLSDAQQLVVVSPEGDRADVLGTSVRYARDDVAKAMGDGARDLELCGFTATVRLPFASVGRAGWTLELAARDGTFATRSAAPLVSDRATVRDRLLSLAVRLPMETDDVLCERVLHPAFSALQARHAASVSVAREASFGPVPAAPKVTAIVPLYGRTDFVEHQLAQFTWDPAMQDVELLYVLDSPELERQLMEHAPPVFELYRVPFRVLILNKNAGYSLANNVAAKHARGEYLLLLNSDVIPTAPGWVSPLVEALTGAPNVGAVGAKLVYEDETLQHAGMHFVKSACGRHWQNEHYFKGFERDFPAANIAREVPAATGACLMLSAALFREIGGLAGSYVQGDFEDSDLCLRVRERGLKIRYLPHVELYHLEGQSYPGPLRHATFRYNSWLHTRLWNAAITDIVAAAPKFQRVDL